MTGLNASRALFVTRNERPKMVAQPMPAIYNFGDSIDVFASGVGYKHPAIKDAPAALGANLSELIHLFNNSDSSNIIRHHENLLVSGYYFLIRG